MPWYKSGTVACTQNSSTVIGQSSDFAANCRVGDAFIGPDGRWYEVVNIPSATVLSIDPTYAGPSVDGARYSIMPVQGYNRDSATALRQATQAFTDGTSSAGENAAKAAQSAAAALESQGAAEGAADTATEKAQAATSAANTATQQAQAAAGDRQAADSAATNAGKSASDAKGYRDQAALSAASIDTSKLVNKAGDTITGPLNWAPRVDVADSATPAIGAAASNSVNLIGATTVTGFDALASGVRLVRFNASRTLKHEAGKLDLVGGADIVTAAGDTALFEARGSSGWRMAFYQRKDGKALKGSSDGNAQILKSTSTAVGQTTFNFPTGYTVGSPIWYQGTLLDSQDYTATDGNNVVLQVGAKSVGEIMTLFNVAGTLASDPTKLPLSGGQMLGALDFQAPVTIADSATPAVGACGSNNVVLAGTTTISGFDVIAAGAVRWVKFSGSRLLNHDATKLALLGGANIQTNAGDMAVFRSLGGGNWEMLDYTASLPPGSIFSKEWTSANQAISSNGRITLAHGMNVVPKMSSLELICLVANAEYSVGDVIPLPNAQGTSANFGYQLKWSTANVVIMYAAANLLVLVSSGTWTTLNTAQWAVRVRAWA